MSCFNEHGSASDIRVMEDPYAKAKERMDAAKPYMTAEVVRTIAAMSVVPTNGHGAQVEWHLNGFDVEIEFDHNGVLCGVAWSKP